MSQNQPEHPNDCAFEDCVSKREGTAYGLAHAGEFCGTHQVMMQRLIAAYSDRDAHDALDNLRELFWARLWQPATSQSIQKGDWFKLKQGDDWGRVYYSRAPLTDSGTANGGREYRLLDGELVRVRLPNGSERDGKIALRKTSRDVSDHGHSYSVRSSVPFVQFDDGTEVSLLVADLQYDPARDPTAGQPNKGSKP